MLWGGVGGEKCKMGQEGVMYRKKEQRSRRVRMRVKEGGKEEEE